MHSMIALTDKSESGAKAPAAATIGPIVDAKLYAGPIDADESTDRSKKRKTRGKCRAFGPADVMPAVFAESILLSGRCRSRCRRRRRFRRKAFADLTIRFVPRVDGGDNREDSRNFHKDCGQMHERYEPNDQQRNEQQREKQLDRVHLRFQRAEQHVTGE